MWKNKFGSFAIEASINRLTVGFLTPEKNDNQLKCVENLL